MTITVSSLEEMSAFVESLGSGKYAFRGQSVATWDLVPSLFRGMEKLDLSNGGELFVENAERDIFRDFSDFYRPRTSADWVQTSWDVLVLAQHHGTPTRLLDWTSNPQIALYFAATASPNNDGAVWWANPAAIPVPAELGRIHNGLGYRQEKLARYVVERKLPFCHPHSETIGSSPSHKPVYDQNGNPELSGILTFFVPGHSNSRVAVQNGTFSVYITDQEGELVMDHAAYLRAVEKFTGERILEKAVIPAKYKRGILLSLDRVGVNALTLFPDLYGLGEYQRLRQQRFVESMHPNP